MIARFRTYNSDPGSLAITRNGKPWLWLRLLHYYPIWAVEKRWRRSDLGRRVDAWSQRRWP